ncbi:protein of unknown function [Parasphingorhabdus marina DSM 22363]|uniref:DUF3291 domain-containing protein n=1 Tax=Parasphingorhabdus marina DSM 22363 TaxID=1123272 RepID=A0A1N6CSW9_9SPHN|nr:DUF3291 domain-containing protein [Parasphingorhabdus marina]SIN61708.1 protein of unknown function [Parasphingorhabdus marina DSM 22363]
MSGYHLAQVNVANFRRPKDDPVNKDFVDALEKVNAAADAAPGFVWRLQGENGNALDIPAGSSVDPNLVVNLSVWKDVESLRNFVYRQMDHVAVLKRREEWFDSTVSRMALWWIPEGHRPDPAEAIARVRFLEKYGPKTKAFTFQEIFAPPDAG